VSDGGRGSVLLTGCGTGIGHAAAERLAGEGWQVFAGVRDLSAAPSSNDRKIVLLQLDVTDAEQVASARTKIEETGGSLDGVVHNAGIPIGGALEAVSAEELRRIFEVNVIAPVLLTQALLPLLRSAGGRVVLVGSLGGRVAFPFAGPYHATKFALEGLADSLRLELGPQGVGVAIVEPGAISTPIWSKALRQVEAQRQGLSKEGRALYGERLKAFEERLRSADRNGDPPEKVASKIAEALGAKGSRYPVGRGAGTLSRLRPLLRDFAFDRLVGERLG
jgi:NAD(P)-dependent dehydrogenase (short-subunit alcohol dehydrogenase family)